MKFYKVFYKDNEVAEFNQMKEVIDYIEEQIKNDEELLKKDFHCYMKVG